MRLLYEQEAEARSRLEVQEEILRIENEQMLGKAELCPRTSPLVTTSCPVSTVESWVHSAASTLPPVPTGVSSSSTSVAVSSLYTCTSQPLMSHAARTVWRNVNLNDNHSLNLNVMASSFVPTSLTTANAFSAIPSTTPLFERPPAPTITTYVRGPAPTTASYQPRVPAA